MKTIVDVLREVREARPGLRLTDGDRVWSIEDLARKAEQDREDEDPATLMPSFFWGYTGDKRVAVSQFHPEYGTFTVLTEPSPGLMRYKVSDVLPIVVGRDRKKKKKKR